VLDPELSHDAGGVALRDRGGVGVAAVEQHLHSRAAAGIQVGGEAGRDLDADEGATAVERLADVGGAVRGAR
jgi:hypothetical protein